MPVGQGGEVGGQTGRLHRACDPPLALSGRHLRVESRRRRSRPPSPRTERPLAARSRSASARRPGGARARRCRPRRPSRRHVPQPRHGVDQRGLAAPVGPTMASVPPAGTSTRHPRPARLRPHARATARGPANRVAGRRAFAWEERLRRSEPVAGAGDPPGSHQNRSEDRRWPDGWPADRAPAPRRRHRAARPPGSSPRAMVGNDR